MKIVNKKEVKRYYKKKGDDTNFQFGVGREKLSLTNGKYTGCDALYRLDNGNPLSVVSHKYVLTTHSQSNEFVERFLQSQNIAFEVGQLAVAFKGNRFFKEFRFPSMKFCPGEGTVKNTALDGKPNDEYHPTIIARNSYDKSCTLDFLYGLHRKVCENGLVIGMTIQKISVKHIENPDYEKIATEFLTKMEQTIEGFKRVYERLNSEDANPYLTSLLIEIFSHNMTAEAIAMLPPGSVIADVDDNGQIQDVEMRSSISAYLLYQVATAIATHRVNKYHRSLQLQQKISRLFKV